MHLITAVDAFKEEVRMVTMVCIKRCMISSTQSGKTTVQLNPIGGSENFPRRFRKCPSMTGATTIKNSKFREQALKDSPNKIWRTNGWSSSKILEVNPFMSVLNDWVSQGNMHTAGIVKILRGILCKR